MTVSLKKRVASEKTKTVFQPFIHSLVLESGTSKTTNIHRSNSKGSVWSSPKRSEFCGLGWVIM